MAERGGDRVAERGRRALQGVDDALGLQHLAVIGWVAVERHQGAIEGGQVIVGLLDEDAEEFVVDLFVEVLVLGAPRRRADVDNHVFALLPARRDEFVGLDLRDEPGVPRFERGVLVREGGGIDARIGAEALDEQVAAVDEIEDGHGGDEAMFVDLIQHVLDTPTGVAEQLEADHPRRALDGVRRAPQIGHDRPIGGPQAQLAGRVHPGG